MIKGRGCREDVEGKGDGQAMVVRCHPALALHVVASSASASRVVTSVLHVLVASFSHVITSCRRLVAWLCRGVIISSSCLSVWWAGKKVGRGCLLCCFKMRSDDERRISVVVRRLVATLLSATWHLVSVLDMSVGGR